MATRLKNLDRDTPMLLPPDLRDWIPQKHIVHFLIDAVDRLPAENFRFNQRGTGDEQYPPRMMLTLLIYCYATGRFSSRVIEEASWSDVIVRYICGGDLHPDTICSFRRTNRELFEKAFVQVLLMAQETAGLRKVGTVSVDGTKIKANASKHSAVSYKRAGEQIELLRKEVGQLTDKAEQIDNVPLDDGLSIPDEIVRREDRIKNLEHARRVIEARYEEERVQEQAEYEKKKAAYDEKKKNRKPRGKEPKPPSETPPDKMQYNFTDPESRIMKAGGSSFEQAFNAQAAVDTKTLLIVGGYVTDAPTDKQQLVPAAQSIPAEVALPENILSDTGYYGDEHIRKTEALSGATVYCAQAKSAHRLRVADLEKQPPPEPPRPGAPMKEQMAHRLKTPEGKSLYKLRKQTVEPVFGIIKEVIGFRRFSMRGKEKAETEWRLVCLSYNLKKMFKLAQGCAPKRPIETAKRHVPAHSAQIGRGSATFSWTFKHFLHGLLLSFEAACLPETLTPTGC